MGPLSTKREEVKKTERGRTTVKGEESWRVGVALGLNKIELSKEEKGG